MKIAIIGATGWIGGQILQEAIKRKHQVTAIARDITKVANGIETKEFDLNSNTDIASVLGNVDVVIASIGGRASGKHDIVKKTAVRLLAALDRTSTRILWVGGAGSLEVAPGVSLMSTPEFPVEYKDEAIAQGEALNEFRQTKTDVKWTFVSPAAIIYPGESEAEYRLGGDQFFTNDKGESKVSVTDYAIAMLDEAEKATHIGKRISVAY